MVHTAAEPVVDGFDLVVCVGRRTLVVRCLPGHQVADPAIGREMTAIVTDKGADAGIIVAAAGTTAELRTYLRDRPITVLHPSEIRITDE